VKPLAFSPGLVMSALQVLKISAGCAGFQDFEVVWALLVLRVVMASLSHDWFGLSS
jgi:hypothetical protein